MANHHTTQHTLLGAWRLCSSSYSCIFCAVNAIFRSQDPQSRFCMILLVEWQPECLRRPGAPWHSQGPETQASCEADVGHARGDASPGRPHLRHGHGRLRFAGTWSTYLCWMTKRLDEAASAARTARAKTGGGTTDASG
eukprot:SAG22_NODE_508_length_9621_cov_30.889414_5_plen_139_part_00